MNRLTPALDTSQKMCSRANTGLMKNNAMDWECKVYYHAIQQK